MIHSITVTNSYGEPLLISLRSPEQSGLIVKDIAGLGPGVSTINLREQPFLPGATYMSSRTGVRNLVFTFQFMPTASNENHKPTIEQTRLRTYKYFQNQSLISLAFSTDAGIFHIQGFVESNEPIIFSQYEGCSISVLCPDPMFRTLATTTSGKFESVVNVFSFPFSDPDFALGDLSFRPTSYTIEHPGTINVGPTFIFEVTSSIVKDPVLLFRAEHDLSAVHSLEFKFSEAGLPDLEFGDLLIINCEKQNKSVIRYIAAMGTAVNYIGAVTIDSDWPVLHPGPNIFSYNATNGPENLKIMYEFPILHGGI